MKPGGGEGGVASRASGSTTACAVGSESAVTGESAHVSRKAATKVFINSIPFEDSHDKGNRKEKVDLAAKDHRCHTDLALQRSQRDRIHTNGICRGPELVDAQRCFARPECALC